MRINAYILVADPAWIEASIASYYDIVENIIVSYDKEGIGYTGLPVSVGECLRRLSVIDKDHKLIYSPGHYARLSHTPMENETYQRQCALDEASKTSDWVIQLDTDEVMNDLSVFSSCLQQADELDFSGLDFPARWLYQSIGKDWYLEWCTRFWGLFAGYPGCMAVKSGSVLKHARQCDTTIYKVDFVSGTATNSNNKQTAVHRIIRPNQSIFHYSWVRSEQEMKEKLQSFSHAKDCDWEPQVQRWIWSKKHPYIATAASVLQRGPHKRHIRPVKVGNHFKNQVNPEQA